MTTPNPLSKPRGISLSRALESHYMISNLSIGWLRFIASNNVERIFNDELIDNEIRVQTKVIFPEIWKEDSVWPFGF